MPRRNGKGKGPCGVRRCKNSLDAVLNSHRELLLVQLGRHHRCDVRGESNVASVAHTNSNEPLTSFPRNEVLRARYDQFTRSEQTVEFCRASGGVNRVRRNPAKSEQ